MNIHADKTSENKSPSSANSLSKQQNNSESPVQFADNRPEAITQRKLQDAINNSPRVQQLKSIQKKENNTGLPDNLKSGVENLSGYSMDDVKVHYNSPKPAQLHAHAYAQGNDIHLSGGQEKHLPHEAWHVVQQKQGRVQPTMQMKGGVNVNDDNGLEKEADLMGRQAMFFNPLNIKNTNDFNQSKLNAMKGSTRNTVQAVVKINKITIGKDKVDDLVDKAYKYGETKMHLLPQELIKPNLKTTLTGWMASNPFHLPGGNLLGSIKPSVGLKDDQPKAHWKSFPDYDSFYKQLINDSNPVLLKNQKEEIKLAEQVLGSEKIAANLNELRRAIGVELWKRESVFGKLSYYLTTNPIAGLIPNMGGSYNLANSYPKLREWPTFQDVKKVKPLLQKIFVKADRISLLFSEKKFSVSENVAILHDVKELFSPRNNSRFMPTAHPKLIPHPYQGVNSPAKPMRWEKDNHGNDKRVDVLKKDFQPYEKDPKVDPEEIKWDQGRLGAGTRNEDSPDTKTARKTKMPIETGRSHTAARLFEMVSLLKPKKDAPEKDHKKFAERMKAMSYGIFGYWNAPNKSGGYAKSLTPVHTYHEVMDPAEDYLKGIYSQPFSYEDLKDHLRTP